VSVRACVGTTRTRSNAVLVEHVRRSRTRVFCSIGWRRGNGRKSGIASGHWPTPDHSICEERSRDMKLRWLSPARSCEFATPWYVSALLVGGLPYASGRGAHFIRRLLWFVTHLLLCRCSGGEERNFPIEDAWRPGRRGRRQHGCGQKGRQRHSSRERQQAFGANPDALTGEAHG